MSAAGPAPSMAVISTLMQSRNTTQSFSVSITSRPDIDPKWRGRIFRQGGRALLCYIVRVIVAAPDAGSMPAPKGAGIREQAAVHAADLVMMTKIPLAVLALATTTGASSAQQRKF